VKTHRRLRAPDPGPWADPWAGIARIKVPAGVGLAVAGGAVVGGREEVTFSEPVSTGVID